MIYNTYIKQNNGEKKMTQQAKKDFIKKYKLTKTQILFIEKFNRNDLESLKGGQNSMCALRNKGVFEMVKIGKFYKAEIIEEAKTF